MPKMEEDVAANNAVSFLISRIIEQASSDSILLGGDELRQLSLCGETASPTALSGAVNFDAEQGQDDFEKKIVSLLRQVFWYDVQHGRAAVWQQHLAALRKRDIYLLAMVDQAGIPRPGASGAFAGLSRVRMPRNPMELLRAALFVLLVLIVISGAFFFFVVRNVNSPLWDIRERLIPNENKRALFFIVWIASVYLLGREMQRR